ncbi:conserved hypothetical protein [Histoplasma capsulatum H143]|uniref:Uncharacterized protein n=1 Tax=Ajellomyces capsulatus (strain H143) TaxID=544712 RepID=C6HT99_AJECH|nr:conserved hypothetical protein [Histoplasma capsulatum H143]
MVNLRSGSAPDLTREYVPLNRRTQETPDNEIKNESGSLPTPATVRRRPMEARELTSEGSGSEFEDPMSERSSSGQRDQEDADIVRMKLEIARLQHEVERMRTNRSASSVREDLDADVADYLQQRGTTPSIMKIIKQFKQQVELIAEPVRLLGFANYSTWREDVLRAVEHSETGDILDNKELSPAEGASVCMQRLWKERNSWLYGYMWSSISMQARAHFTLSKDNRMSAYMLWSVIYEELLTLTAVKKGSNRAFIERLLAIRTEYIRIGFPAQDSMFFDRLLTGVSNKWATFIKNRMDAIERDPTAEPLENDLLGLCRDIMMRLPMGEPSKESSKTPTNSAQEANNSGQLSLLQCGRGWAISLDGDCCGSEICRSLWRVSYNSGQLSLLQCGRG